MKALILCGALTLLAAPAVAAPAVGEVRRVSEFSDVFQATVSVAALDLDHAPGAATALDRIRVAAQRVCGARPAPRDLVAVQRHRACVSNAVDTAVATLDAPLVTARYGRRDPARLASR